MKSNILYTLLFLIVPFSGTTQGNLKTIDKEEYTIEYPSKWYVEEMEEMGIILIDDDENPKLITTLVKTPSDGTTLEETRKALLENSGLENTKVVKDEIIKIGEQEMLRLVFLGTSEDNSEPFRIEEFFANHKNQSYMLVFACSEDVYPKMEKTINQISQSFKLK